MGSLGIYVTPEQRTRDVVLEHARHRYGDRFELADHAFTSTGAAQYGDWSAVMYALILDVERNILSAELFLHARQRGRGGAQVVIKSVHEMDGPAQYAGVPQRILKGLSAPGNAYAARWRDRAWGWHTLRRDARASIGKTVRLPYPLSYNGAEETTYTVTSLTTFTDADRSRGRRLRAPADWWSDGFEIVS